MWLSFKRQKEIKPNEKGVILEYPVLHNALAYLIAFLEQSIWKQMDPYLFSYMEMRQKFARCSII